ncbi:hypothetical protein H6G64_01230 [Calothrix sp. FACHB-156]|nr:hypothetical protein [Nostoc linckia FACHB-104]MBD2335611.1 hypothetical protein [Calothrix sp. FACHB-156]
MSLEEYINGTIDQHRATQRLAIAPIRGKGARERGAGGRTYNLEDGSSMAMRFL